MINETRPFTLPNATDGLAVSRHGFMNGKIENQFSHVLNPHTNVSILWVSDCPALFRAVVLTFLAVSPRPAYILSNKVYAHDEVDA